MNVMSIDVELNQPSRKIISVGIAIFNAHSGQMLETEELYVNPHEPLHPEIIELTGINDSDLVNGMTVTEAYSEIKRLSEKWKCFRNPIVWGSGVSNDSLLIYQQSGVSEENFMGFRVIDAKTLYQSMQIYKNKQYAGGLKDVCERLGIGFEGDPHRALTDAINTFRVWHFLSKKME